MDDLNVEMPFATESDNDFISRITEERVQFIKDYMAQRDFKHAVFGLSGGIDSFVLFGLLKMAAIENIIPVYNPCEEEDEEDIVACEQLFDIPVKRIPLKNASMEITDDEILQGSYISRIRSATLYVVAGSCRGVVFGTNHASEAVLGLFRKYGESGVDVQPLHGLLKQDIRKMAKLMGCPDSIMHKESSPCLSSADPTLSYDHIYRYFRKGEPNENIERVYHSTRHKRHMAATPNSTWWKEQKSR